jgi:colanic acid/amylovoran biosynthesis protein
MKKRRIGLVNSVILNGGDAGIVYGTCDAINDALPGVEITVFAHKAAAAAKYYPDLRLAPMFFDSWPRSRIVRGMLRRTYALRHALGLRSRSERRFQEELKACDAIVYCGGGYLNDSYDMQLLFSIIEVSLGTGVPHMAYAHSIGPITRPHSLASAHRLLSRFDVVTARDDASFELLQRLGVPQDRIGLLADAALAMRVEEGDTMSQSDRTAVEAIRDFKSSNGKPLVFMSVRAWRFPGQEDPASLSRNLHEQLVHLARQILAVTNWSICFVSTCQGRAEYTYDDAAVARQVVAELGGESSRVMVSAHAFAPRTYPYLIRTCADLVISMRMHLTIFSLLGGVPFVAIAYEKKSVELCRKLGIEEFCHEAAGLDASTALASATRVYEQRVAVSAQLRQKRDEMIVLSKENAVLLAQRCFNPPGPEPSQDA